MAFDLNQYLPISARDASATLDLAAALLKSAPEPVPPLMQTAYDDVKTKHALLLERVQARAKLSPSEVKGLNTWEDVAWSLLRERLHPWTLLPEHPDAKTAEELSQRLFPKGLSFLTLSFAKQWAHSQHLLELVANDADQAALERLIGRPFLDNLNAAHKALGEALGMGTELPESPETLIAEPLRALLTAIERYAICAMAYGMESSTEAAAAAALRPLAEFKTRRRASSPAEPAPSPEEAAKPAVTPEEPAP
jgi:hypothetical protein